MKALPRTDAHLQLSRRLDWRFLLPEPYLRRVAYWGPEKTMLVQALNTFSASVTFFSPANVAASAAPAAHFDLAVLIAPTPVHLETAAARLVTGGCLYAEMQSAWHSVEKGGRLSFAKSFVGLESYVTTLRRLGFAEIKAYWHRPSFEQCVQIIPLHDDRAMEFVFSQRAVDLLSQIKFATGKSLLKAHWLLRLFQSVSLVACHPWVCHPTHEFDSHISQPKLAAAEAGSAG